MAEVEWSKHKTEDGGCWGEVMMNRPERKNAITGPFGEQLAQAFEELQQDSEVQTILLYGAGGAFCSGLDLNAFNAEPERIGLLVFKRPGVVPTALCLIVLNPLLAR